MTLSFTGERFLPECQGEMVYEHWQRYLLAHGLAAGCRVLDVASGEGYGADLIATAAGEVVGVDVSAEAVAHAASRYQRHNLRFLAASCTSIPEPEGSFDLVCSFETIEHIEAQAEFVAEVDRLLAPAGVFLLSSPNRPQYSGSSGYRNEFHIAELDREELAALLSPRFPHQRWFAQRALFHSMLWPLERAAEGTRLVAIDGTADWPEPMYFVVVAARTADALSRAEARLGTPIHLVSDRAHSVYAEWSRTYRENAASRQEIETLRERVARLEARLREASQEPASIAPPLGTEPWLVRLARRLSGGGRG